MKGVPAMYEHTLARFKMLNQQRGMDFSGDHSHESTFTRMQTKYHANYEELHKILMIVSTAK